MKKKKMTNHRLVGKDYKRLRRKQQEELKKGASNTKKSERSHLTVLDELTSMGRKNRDRVLRRWSEKSIRSGSVWKREGNQAMKTVNGGKLQRDRGRIRKAELDEKEQSKTGIYTRVGVDLTNGESELTSLEKRFEQRSSPKRKAIGRKGTASERMWLAPQCLSVNENEVGEERGEKYIHGRRSSLKRARSKPSTEVSFAKGKTLEGKRKSFYSMSRRTRRRIQRKGMTHGRVSREKVRLKLESNSDQTSMK